LLERVAEDKATIEWRGRWSHQNQSLAVVGFKSGFWGKKEFLFDPSRGYLPARIAEQTHGWPEKKPHSPHQTHLLEAKDAGKGRWFPMHVVNIRVPPEAGAQVDVVDVRVTELVVDKVSKEDLSIDVPAGTGVTWSDVSVDGLCHFRLRQDEKLTPDDIPRLEEMLKKSVVGR
jgi:hypothetical protein